MPIRPISHKLDCQFPGPSPSMVIYRSKLHATLERNYQLMPASKWLRLLMNHIPDQ